MKILLTNDDGIHAEGMKKLIELAMPLGHELAVVAPKSNNSGAGHSITLWREVEILRLEGLEDIDIRWQVDGTPVDAVKFALGNDIFEPDFILSGINSGPNMGRNIYYSGTVGAALEGLFHGISSVALSVENWEEPMWEPAVEVGREIVEQAIKVEAARPSEGMPFLLNVNFPDRHSSQVKGKRITRQGSCGFAEKFFPSRENKPDHFYLSGVVTMPDADEMIDAVAVRDGYVSITPLHPYMNCSHSLNPLEKAFYENSYSSDHWGEQ